METEDDFDTVDNMERFGGSFVKALANAMRHADKTNFTILKNSFPRYWNEYNQK